MNIDLKQWNYIVKIFNKILPFLAMVIFCFVTLKYGIFSGRPCWEDEAHAWTIAQHTNLFQLIELMKVEGHFLLWYLSIMPFAKFNFLYPYPMLLINWLYMVLALVVMWWKAPFNNIIKLCITFSAPIYCLYSVWARCYSIGIFFLFLAMAAYKDRLNHPYKYLLCLVLTANTSLPMCIAAGVLGCLFLYDLIKNRSDKKIFYTIFATLVFHLILYYFQFFGAAVPDYESQHSTSPFILAFLGLYSLPPSLVLYKTVLLKIGLIIFLIFLAKSRRAFTFFMGTSAIIFPFFIFVYNARVHHLFLIYIFALAAFWIYTTEYKNRSKFDWFSIFFITALLEFVFMQITIPYGFTGYRDCIIEEEAMKTAKIYTDVTPIALAPSIPYLEKDGIYLYNLSGVNLSSYEGLKQYFSAEAKKFNPDILASDLDFSKNNYLILTYKLPKNYINGTKQQIKVKLHKTVYFRAQEYYLYVYKVLGVE